MKKIAKVLVFLLLVNLFSSFVYAGPDNFPRPYSYKPITTSTTMDITISYQ